MALRTLRSWLQSPTRKPSRLPSKRPLAVEPLEDRSTPAAIGWDGGAGNLNWFSPANWTGDVVPTLADDVTISGAAGPVEIADTFGVAQVGTLTCGSDLRLVTGQLQIGADATVNGNFTLGGSPFDGTVTGAGTLTLNGAVTWLAGGVMAGTGKTVLNGPSTLTGSTFGSLRETRVLENAGNATVVAGTSFVFRDNPVLRNLSSGTLTFASGAGIGSFFAGAGSKLVNEGALNVTGPSPTTVVVTTENSGHIDADAQLTLAGLINSGTIDAIAAFTAGATTNSGAISAASNLTLSGLTNATTGSVNVGGAFTPGAVINDGVVTATGAANFNSLVNTGTVTAANTLAVNGAVTNSGTVTATGAVTAGTVTNSGAIDADSAVSMSSLANTGTVDVAGATFSVSNGGSNANIIRLGAATVMTAGGTLTLLPNSTITGGAVAVSTFNQLVPTGAVSVDTVRLTGGSIIASAGSEFTIGTLEQNGTVTGSGTVTVTNRWTFTNGTLTGGGRFVTAGTSTLSGGFFATIGNRIVENAGTALVDANQSFTFTAGANWTNLPGSVFELRGGSTASTFFVNPADVFTNRGTILKTGTGTGTIGLPVMNAAGGTVQVLAGTLTLPSGVTSAGTLDVSAGSALRLTGNSTLQAGATATGTGEVQLAGNLTVNGAATLGILKVESGTVTANAVLSVSSMSLNGTLAGTAPVTAGNFTLVNGTLTTDLLLGDWTFNSGTLAGSGNVTVGGTFNLGGGTVSTTGTVTVNGPLNWTAGGMSNTGRTVLNGTSTLSGPLNADGRQFENAGTATVTSGGLTFRGVARWTNLPGSVFEARSGDAIGNFFASGQFVNRGTIRKTTTGTAALRVPVVNEAGGVIDVQQGTLQLFGTNGTSAGVFDIAAGATLAAAAPTTLLAGATSTGAGTFLVGGTTLTVSGASSLANLTVQGGTVTANAPLTVTNLTHSGTLTGPADVTVTGTLTWTAGGMTGTGKTILTGTGTITGNPAVLDGRTIDSTAAVTIGAPAGTASLQFRNNAVWNNLPGGVLELAGTSGVSNFFASATAAVNNSGTIRKTGTAGSVSSVAVPLFNTGRLEITGGDLTTAPNSRSSGTADIIGTGRWVLNNGTTFFDAGATTTGTGVVLIQGGTLTVTGASSIARLQQNTSTTTVNAPLTIGDYLFNAGTLTGTGKTTLTGSSAFAGTALKVLSSHTVDNAGTLTWSGTGGIQTSGAVTFNNLAGAVFDATNDATFAPAGGTPVFNNAGTLRKSVGSGPIYPAIGPRTTWAVPLNNSGTIDIQTGNFQVAPPVGPLSGVTMLANTGTIRVGTAASSAASLVLPVVTTVPGQQSYTLSGGTLTGTGQIGLPNNAANLIVDSGATLGGTLTVFGSVVNRGTVQPATTSGALTVMGNYTQVDDATADGRLVIGLRGDSPSGMFGKVQVNGSATLAGALDVFADGGFLPDFGDVFQVFRSVGPRTGDFTYPADGYDLDGYRVLSPEYDATGLRLNLVTEVGALPVIDPIDDVTVDEGQTVAFTAAAIGAEAPGPLTFSLAAGSEPGATIDPQTGAFQFFASAGPGEYVFQIEAHDPNAPTDPVDVETFKVTVRNVAPVMAVAGGPFALDEGDELVTAGSFADPGADAWTATIDYGDGTGVQPLVLNGDKTFALDHTYLDNGTFTVTVRVFDGFEYGTAAFDVAVANRAPIVVAAGNQSAEEAAEYVFDLGSFTDFGASDAPWAVAVNWGDGSAPSTFDVLQQGQLDPLAHTFADSGSYAVTVTVTDKDGAAASVTFSVVVANRAPAAAVVGPASGVRGQSRTFTLTAADPSTVDQSAGFTFSINWGDGTTQTVSGPSGTTVEHVYTAAGGYTVTVVATDKDGGTSGVVTHSITVLAAEVQDGVLVVGGTTGADQIQFSGWSGQVQANVNGTNLGTFGASSVTVYAQTGNDNIQVNGNFVSAVVSAGAGNDQVQLSGNFTDVSVDGGEGTDQIQASGTFRDVVVHAGAGSGSVQLSGNFRDARVTGGEGVDQIQASGTFRDMVIDSGAGNDQIQVSGNFATLTISAGDGNDVAQVSGSGTSALLAGGAGNDVLMTNGNFPAVLDGGSGDDELNGGSGRDILIGGSGADRLTGAGGDDILIGGVFLGEEPEPVRFASLQSVANTWWGTQSYSDRVAALVGYLAPRVDDDGVSDVLTGSANNDWYLARTSGPVGVVDALNGRTSQEVVTSI